MRVDSQIIANPKLNVPCSSGSPTDLETNASRHHRMPIMDTSKLPEHHGNIVSKDSRGPQLGTHKAKRFWTFRTADNKNSSLGCIGISDLQLFSNFFPPFKCKAHYSDEGKRSSNPKAALHYLEEEQRRNNSCTAFTLFR